jgi:hypothetical protein
MGLCPKFIVFSPSTSEGPPHKISSEPPRISRRLNVLEVIILQDIRKELFATVLMVHGK